MNSPGTPFPLSILDRNQQQIDISWSSLATEPAVRIYVNSSTGDTLGCAHLTVEQATAVRNALTAWLEEAAEGTPADED